MALSINEVKNGLTILVGGDIYMVIDTQHVKPGKGAAFLRVKLRNMRTDNVQDMTFRGEEKIEPAFVEQRKLQYLYLTQGLLHFMDQDNYEEVAIAQEAIGENRKFLKDNIEVTGLFYKGAPLTISLPNFVEYKIVHTEPGIKGDTAKSGGKPAEIESGAVIQVPLFVDKGDTVKVDTRTGSYVERAYK